VGSVQVLDRFVQRLKMVAILVVFVAIGNDVVDR